MVIISIFRVHCSARMPRAAGSVCGQIVRMIVGDKLQWKRAVAQLLPYVSQKHGCLDSLQHRLIKTIFLVASSCHVSFLLQSSEITF